MKKAETTNLGTDASIDSGRTLVDCRRNDVGRVVRLPEDDRLRSQSIRLGIAVDARIRCVERLPGGTIVVAVGRQEIAIGHRLAASIVIEPGGEGSE